jgi:hypothetical protein
MKTETELQEFLTQDESIYYVKISLLTGAIFDIMS